MSQITVNQSLCKKDGACVAVCPTRTIALNAEGFPEEVPEAGCMLCGHCVAVCPTGALTHSELPDEAFLPASKELPSPALMDGFLISRRSVREFKKRPVARETLEAPAGCGAACADGVQLTKSALDCRRGWGKGARLGAGDGELLAEFRNQSRQVGSVEKRIRLCLAGCSHACRRMRASRL